MADPIHYRYDTFSVRIAAMIIDTLILIAPSFLLQTVVEMTGVFWLIFLLSIFTAIAGRAYFILGHGLYGRTVGKKTQNVRVVDFKTEQPISIIQALKRELLFIPLVAIGMAISAVIDSVPVTDASTLSYLGSAVLVINLTFVGVQIAYCLSNPKRRALHDLIGGTVVVRENVPLVPITNETPAPSEG